MNEAINKLIHKYLGIAKLNPCKKCPLLAIREIKMLRNLSVSHYVLIHPQMLNLNLFPDAILQQELIILLIAQII